MEFALPTALAALVVLAVYGRVRARPRRTQGAPATSGAPPGAHATVVLDVGDVSGEGETLQRIVREAAGRAFADQPRVAEVEVRNRNGVLLGRVTAMTEPFVPLLTPHIIRPTSDPLPAGIERELHPTVTPHLDAKERPAPSRRFADGFDLPETVRGRMDPADLGRREFLAPELRHVGARAIQRMADAVSIGADPLAFASAPPVIGTTVTATAHEGSR